MSRTKIKVETPSAPSPGSSPHSQAIIANGFVFTQGVICLTPEGKLVAGSVAEQIEQIMRNLSAILGSAGVSFFDVVKTTIYVTDMAIYATVNEIYAKYFNEPYPARETICVAALPLGAEVEISMIAYKG